MIHTIQDVSKVLPHSTQDFRTGRQRFIDVCRDCRSYLLVILNLVVLHMHDAREGLGMVHLFPDGTGLRRHD